MASDIDSLLARRRAARESLSRLSGDSGPSARDQKIEGGSSLVGSALGSIIGAYYGGPAGAKAGGAIGGAAGGDIGKVISGNAKDIDLKKFVIPGAQVLYKPDESDKNAQAKKAKAKADRAESAKADDTASKIASGNAPAGFEQYLSDNPVSGDTLGSGVANSDSIINNGAFNDELYSVLRAAYKDEGQ